MCNYINKIINVDCLEGLKKIEKDSIDLVITSPPYNFNIKYDSYNDDLTIERYLQFIQDVAEKLYEIIKSDGRVCINIPCDGSMRINEKDKVKCDTSFMIKEIFYKSGFKYRDKIYWDKNNFKSRTAWGSFKSCSSPNILLKFEEIVVFYKGERRKEKTNDFCTSDINKDEFIKYTNGHWVICGKSNKKSDECPVPFPEELVERLIKLFSYTNDIVLDPFCGSGTTCIVANRLKRRYTGFEISKKYVDDANKKINYKKYD